LLGVDFNIVKRKQYKPFKLIKKKTFFTMFLFRLKYFGDNTYEVDGFTTSIQAKNEDIESLATPNSSKLNNLA